MPIGFSFGLPAMPLRRHLFALVLVTLLPMLVLGATLAAWLATERSESVEQGLRATAKALALAFDREATANLAALEGLAASEALAADDLPAFHDRAVLARHQHPNWYSVILLDATGRPLLHTGRPYGQPLPDGANLDFVWPAREAQQPVVSDLIIGPVTGQPGIAHVVPVRRGGEVRYLLAAVVRPEAWSTLLAEFSAGTGTILAATDGAGRLIARNRDAAPFVGRAAPAWFEAARRTAPEGVARGTCLEGYEVVGAFHASRRTGWTVFVGVPMADIDAPVRRTLWASGGLAGLLCLVALALGRTVARRVTGTMDTLTEAGRALAELKPIVSPGPVPVLEVDRLWQVLAGASAELLNATRATQHAEARYRSIVDTAVDAMVVIDEAGAVQSFNKAAERIFGYAADKVLGRNVKVLMPEPDHGGHDGYLTRYRQTGERKIIGIGREVRGRRQDGSTFPLELAIAEWRADGQRFFTGIMRDISARKDAEQGLGESQAAMQVAKEEAERANLAKSKFLAAASHDLRQPLQSLFFISNTLTRHVQTEAGRDLLVRLGQGLHALKDLLDSLLDVSKLDAGAIRPEIAAVALGPLVEDIVASYTPIAAAKGLMVSAAPSCDLVICTDRTLLGRIVRNLVENAIRYTAHGKVHLGCHRVGDSVRIDVADTGIGIPPEHLERIWEEFHQVGNPERDRSQGLGLGLAIVRRLARLLGHAVEVRSNPGEGSVFSVRVPLAAAGHPMPAAAAEDAMANATAGHGRLALAVDDDAIVLMGLEDILVDAGYEVLSAMSAAEAVQLLKQAGRIPDIVVSDYRLRDGQVGTECIRHIRAFLGRAVPGIILTGETGPAAVSDIAAHGLGMAHKPITAHQMHAVIERQIATAA
jgi:PAS domain S-box-containing protein